MPIPITEALDECAALARTKADEVRRLPRYMVSAAFAGAWVGIGIVLIVSLGGPLAAAHSPALKLVLGAAFGVALTLVVFAGAELFTGNNMFMLQGLRAGTVTVVELAAVWAASLVGNLVGSIGLAALFNAGGTLGIGAANGKPGPSNALVASILSGKIQADGPQLFWRAVLCNMLVCLALWTAARTRSDGAKLALIWWCLLAFIGAGLEHSVANMTLFGLGIFAHSAGWGDLWWNLAWTVPGNIVGGGVVIGLGYAFTGGLTRSPEAAMARANGYGADVDLAALGTAATTATPAAPSPAQ
jgi:nitrite transporter NirC